MNTRKACPERREAIAELAMGTLAIEDQAELRGHLGSCEGCRNFHETLQQQEQEVVSAFELIGRAARAGGQAPPLPDRTVARGVARSRVVRLFRGVARMSLPAKAGMIAVLVIGLASVWTWWERPEKPGQVGHQDALPARILAQTAYASVLLKIDKAHSVACTKTVWADGEEPTTMRQTTAEGGRERVVFDNGFTIITDFAKGDTLTLMPGRKVANLKHSLSGDQQRLIHLADWVRTLHERDGKFAGQEIVDGRFTNVYKVDQPYEKITVWTDPWTVLPVRVEKVRLPCTDKNIRVPEMRLSTSDFVEGDSEQAKSISGPSFASTHWGPGMLEKKTTLIMTDFTWNAEYDESLFSLTPPDGYEVMEKTEYGNAVSDQNALIEALRFWAETSQGRFPADINMLADSQPNLVRKYRPVGPPAEAIKQALPMMHTVLAGMAFAQELKLEDNWHYAGKDVMPGETSKPLCWWLDKDTKMWRVVYGDLSVQNMPAQPTGSSQ